VLGTSTSFAHEGRRFLVTAGHILKKDERDLASGDIDFEKIAFPDAPMKAGLHSLGSIHVYRPHPSANIDVAVIELLDSDAIAALDRGWGALGFDQIDVYPSHGAFLVHGFLFEGATAVDRNIGQKFLAFRTLPLTYTPPVSNPNPAYDRFLQLEKVAELDDGSPTRVPNFKGMSGASVWSLQQTGQLWDPSRALKVVGVQCAARAGHWIQCTDWSAVLAIFRDSEVGFKSPP
jgi:hypothetical protein